MNKPSNAIENNPPRIEGRVILKAAFGEYIKHKIKYKIKAAGAKSFIQVVLKTETLCEISFFKSIAFTPEGKNLLSKSPFIIITVVFLSIKNSFKIGRLSFSTVKNSRGYFICKSLLRADSGKKYA